MDDRINKLKAYMDFFNQSGANVNVNPESSIYNNKRALDWANQQIGMDVQQQAMRGPQMPNFFGGGDQPAYKPLQYTQPQQFNEPNPYAGNAQQLNDGVTNNLMKLLRGDKPIGYRMGGTTGVRG